MKRRIIYIISVIVIVLLILLGDEGARPLVLKGTDLLQSAGASDWTGLINIDESHAYYGLFCNSEDYMLSKGTYSIRPLYTDTGNGDILEVWDDGVKVAQWTFENTNGQQVEKDYTFTLDHDSQRTHFRIYYQGVGGIILNQVSIVPEGKFYQDARFMVIAVLLLAAIGFFLLEYEKKHPLTRDQKLTACILTGLCVYASMPLFINAFPQSDDICYHLMRIEGIKDGLLEGQFPVVIYPNALSGNGYLNTMYPNLFLYIPALIRMSGVSLALSYKLLIFMANVATIGVTWMCLKSMTRSRYARLLGTLLYILLPYRFTNIYARGALGETLAMTFLPLILAGFYHVLMGDKKKWTWLVIGFTGVIQSHVLSTAFMAGIFGVSCLLFIRDLFREKRIWELVKAAALTVLLNLWFLVPFVYCYFKEFIYPKALEWSGFTEYSINAAYLTDTFHTSDYRFLSFGLPVLGCAAVCVMVLICERKKEKRDRFLSYLFGAGCALAFMVTGYFGSMRLREILPFTEKILSTIQFPWRLLAPAGLLFIFAGVIWLSESEILRPYRNLIFVLLAGINLLTCLNQPYNQNNFSYLEYDDTTTVGHEDKLKGIPKSDATVYYPYEWRLDAVTDDKLTADIQVSDAVTVEGYSKLGTRAELYYSAAGDGQYVDFPLQAYIGYRAEDENGEKMDITYGNNYRVRVKLNGDGESHKVWLRYVRPVSYRVGEIVSLLTFVGCIVWIIRTRRRGRMAA